MADLLVEAQESLSETGVVSGIEVKKTRLQAKHLKRQLDLEKERFTQLMEVHKEQVQIKEEEIQQAEKAWQSAKHQLDLMAVKAGIDGILQRLPVNLGQSVAIGDELALVGSKDGLIAEIQVPQLQASLVKIGSISEVDTRHGLINGHVIRIDPVVENGAVKLDIQLPEKLSESIRPMQTVDATIFGQNRSNISSVQKPLGVTQNMSFDVFKLIADNKAQRINVQFGQVSNSNIEVISGLKAGERIIISSPDIASDVEIVQLVN
jgi:multidrug efflux pump subunit AcrA (membrane-fusion protein)